MTAATSATNANGTAGPATAAPKADAQVRRVVIPHDPVHEVAVIAAAARDPAALQAMIHRVRPDHFVNADHSLAWEAVLDLHRQKMVIDLAAVRGLAGERAAQTVEGCLEAMPELPANLEWHVEGLLWDATRVRAAKGPVTAFLETLKDNRADPHQLAALARKVSASFDVVPGAPKWTPTWKAALTLPERARGACVSTGIPSLDDLLRGGLRVGKVGVTGGGPGAHKTGLSVHTLVTAAEAGIPALYVAADEDADGILVRVGQQLGFDRASLEDGAPLETDKLAARLRTLPLEVVDQQEAGLALEDIAEEHARRAGGKHALLVVDSIQQVVTRAESSSAGAEAARGRVDTRMAVLRSIAKAYRLAVLVVSEVNRGAYEGAGLGSFKESSGIEYGATWAATLRAGDGTRDVVITLQKNRQGDKGSVGVRHDPERAKYVDLGPLSGASEKDEVNAGDVLAVLREHHGTGLLITRIRELVAEKRGAKRGSKANSRTVERHLASLVKEGTAFECWVTGRAKRSGEQPRWRGWTVRGPNETFGAEHIGAPGENEIDAAMRRM